MSIFRNRPLALGCFAFLLCLFVSYFLGNIFSILIIALGVLLLGGAILYRTLKNTRFANEFLVIALPLCLCLVVCGIVGISRFGKDKSTANEYKYCTRETELWITDIKYSNSIETLAVANENGNDILVSFETKENITLKVGDIVKGTAYFHSLENDKVGYSEAEYYLDKGIFLKAECEKYEVTSEKPLVFKSICVQINSFLDEILEKHLNADTYALTSAMLLGNKYNLDDGVRRDFSRLGISHILALSGIHVSLITGLFSAFLDTIKIKRRIKYLALISIIASFVCITGLSESAMRAGLMLAIFYTLSIFGNESDAVTSLLLSVSLICLLDPYSIFSTSLLLSFFAMLGCLCSSYYTRGVCVLYRIRPKFLRAAVYSFITSVIVILFTLPIMCIRFDYVSVFAPFFNIIFVPILTLLLYIAPVVLALGWIPYLSYAATFPAEIITKITLFLTGNISKADFLTVPLKNAFVYAGVVIIAVALILALVLSKKQFRYALITLCVGVGLFVVSSLGVAIYKSNVVTISSYNYKSCDIIAIESKNEVMIIEASSPSRTNSKKSDSYAKYLGYSDIDAYVLTDYSTKIVDAIKNVTSSNMVRRVLILEPQTNEEIELFEEAQQYLDAKGIALEAMPQEYNFGKANIIFETLDAISYSSKRCALLRVEANGSAYSYIGSGAFEYLSNKPEEFIAGASVVTFGAYGPKYRVKYGYDSLRARYLVFHGNSKKYIFDIPEEISVKEPTHKFTFK